VNKRGQKILKEVISWRKREQRTGQVFAGMYNEFRLFILFYFIFIFIFGYF